MRWEPPHEIYDAIAIDDGALARHVAALTERLARWRMQPVPTETLPP
jgi:hypothetical protein